MKKILVLGSLFFSFVASASVNLPQFLVGNWSQANRYTEKDEIKIGADLSFVQEITRQVGRDGTSVPYPTVCRYRQTGKVDSFARVSFETIQYYIEAGKEDPRYDMGYNVKKVELIASSSNSANCSDFIKKENDEAAARDGLHYTWTFKDLTDNVILDPWYINVFIK